MAMSMKLKFSIFKLLKSVNVYKYYYYNYQY